MKKGLTAFVLSAVTLLFAAGMSCAAEVKTVDVKGAAKTTADGVKSDAKGAVDKGKADAKGVADKTKADAKAKVVDINAATEAELKAIPGIGDAYAAKIVAGRPYAKKDQLKSRNILPGPVYEKTKDLMIAKQPAKEAVKSVTKEVPARK